MEISDLLKPSKKVGVLTGAGVSTLSGIPDFQSTDKTWPYELPRTEMISIEFFHRNPTRFWQVYRELFSTKLTAEPNHVHQWLAELDKKHEVTIITQNVDGLHQKAGSSHVLELHGSLSTASCARKCSTENLADYEDVVLPRCPKCGKPLKPDVVLFGESPKRLLEAKTAALNSDVFLVLGTALDVSPANSLPFYASLSNTSQLVWINRDGVPPMFQFDYFWRGDFADFPKGSLREPFGFDPFDVYDRI